MSAKDAYKDGIFVYNDVDGGLTVTEMAAKIGSKMIFSVFCSIISMDLLNLWL